MFRNTGRSPGCDLSGRNGAPLSGKSKGELRAIACQYRQIFTCTGLGQKVAFPGMPLRAVALGHLLLDPLPERERASRADWEAFWLLFV